MVLSDQVKSDLESAAWVDFENKNSTKRINKSLFFFRAVYHSKHHVIPHPVIAGILDVILNILQR